MTGDEGGGVPRLATEILTRLECGQYPNLIEAYEGRALDEEPLAAADMALYTGRTTTARRILERAPQCELRDVLEAEAMIAEGDFGGAKAKLAGLGGVRAALNRARIPCIRGEWARTVERALAAFDAAALAGAEFYTGRALQIYGRALRHVGRNRKAGEPLRRAVEILERLEGGRFASAARNELGWHYSDAGDLVCAEREFRRGLALAEAVGHAGEVNSRRQSIAYVIYARGDYEGARRFAVEMAERAIAGRDHENEVYALRLLACASLVLHREREALEAAESLEIADSALGSGNRAFSEALRIRAEGRLGDRSAVERIEALLPEIDEDEATWRAAVVRLWIWDVLRATDPFAARERRAEFVRDAETDPHSYVRAEYRAVRETKHAVVITRDDELVVNLRRFGTECCGKGALEAAEGALVYAAGLVGDHKLVEMGPLLGVSRTTVGRLAHEHGVKVRDRGRPTKTRT